MKTQLSFILLSSLFIVSACDQAEETDDHSTFRSYKALKAKHHSTSFSMAGTDNPTEDVGPAPGWPPFHELELAAVMRSADAIYASAFATSGEAEELCPALCGEEDLEWSGEVSALGEYEVADIRWTETERGLDYEAEIRAEVEVNCLCQE